MREAVGRRHSLIATGGIKGMCTATMVFLLALLTALQAAGPPREKAANDFVYKTASDDPSVLSDPEKEVLTMVNDDRREHRLWALKADPVLSRVARAHSEDMVKGDFFGYISPRFGEIRYQLHRAGSSIAMIQYQVQQTPSLGDMMERMRQEEHPLHLKDDTHIGIGITEKRLPRQYFVTLILAKCQALVDPFPATAKPGEAVRLSGRLFATLNDPKIVISPPKGDVYDVPVSIKPPGAFQGTVAFDRAKGEYVVEVTATGKLGPTVTDLMKVYVGVPYPPPEPAQKEESAPSVAQAEAQMLDLINDDRAKAGLTLLKANEPLAAVARAHSADMKHNQFFGHTSPRTGDLEARLKTAHVLLKNSGENIAMDSSISRAHRSLMESPDHRKNILSDKFSEVGIGVVIDENHNLYVTEDFGMPYEAFAAKDWTNSLLAEFNALRKQSGHGAIRRSAELEEVALENSRSMKLRGQLSADTAGEQMRTRNVRGSATTFVLMCGDRPTAAMLDQSAASRLATTSRLGIAIVEDKDPKSGHPRYWVTVILAE
jgi:uncharacterized protein YkwD